MLFRSQIIKRIKDAELDKLNPFIKEFVEIIDNNWFYYEDIVFTQEEIKLINPKNESEEYNLMTNSNVPKLMNKILKVIEGVKLECDLKKDYIAQDSDCYGYYIDNKKNSVPEAYDIWFGTEFYLWEETGYPITIEIWPSEKVKDKDQKKFFEKIEELDISKKDFFKHEEFGKFC